MRYIDVGKVRKESANVLVVEDANPGAPHRQSVYVDDLCDEIDSLRERLAKAEAERDGARIELQHLKLATLAALTKAGIAMLEENPITPSEVKSAIQRLAREREAERARAEKAEAERDAQIKAAEDACHRWDKMERDLAAERARADRYLAAMGEYVDARADVVMLGRQRQALQALRALVEEARRG